MAALFPEGGADHFIGDRVLADAAGRLGALALVDPARRTRAVGRRASTWRCSSPPSRSRTRSARTRCGPAWCSAPRCSCSSRGPAPRARRSRSSPSACSISSGCPPCARSRRRAATRRRRPPSTPRCCASSTSTPRPASASRYRSRATTGRRTTSREAYPLARGWHRQLDRKVNPLFYDERTS